MPKQLKLYEVYARAGEGAPYKRWLSIRDYSIEEAYKHAARSVLEETAFLDYYVKEIGSDDVYMG